MTDTPATTEPQDSALPKTFDPAAIEAKWAAHWEAKGLFRPDRPDAEPFTIVNPPPNVTGALHIGHALDNTLQDVLVRYERLRGKDALWVVGMDHAGIATQMVVERQMAERQDKRTNYSREAFIDKVWEWKAKSGGQITGQLRRLGCSMDWDREQFTMDPHFTRAVTKVFVQLYNEGLLYRDKRLVNWDPGLKTAISDLEVETREVQGGFWRFKYPLADGVTRADGLDYIEVATTRPETMLADMAVAVNADDERYQSIIGKHVILPITGRRVPIIADDHADPELGSGAVKITPGHDFNDFEVGKRAGFKPADMLNMFDADARVVQVNDTLAPIPGEFLGLDRFDAHKPNARQLVVEQMKARRLLVLHVDKDGVEHDFEPRTIQTPYGDRSGQVIEPWLTDQWYVDAATLAKPAIEAVRSGAVDIVPKSWEKTFFNWMENIQPWCVSRQLWWGHRIPVWYGPDNTIFVAEDEDEAARIATIHYKNEGLNSPEIMFLDAIPVQHGNKTVGWYTLPYDSGTRPVGSNTVQLRRDPDVLDTWFSSALWPFATLGWPEESPSPLVGEDQGGGPGASAPDKIPASGEGAVISSAADAAGPHPNPPHKREGTLLSRHYPNDVLISGFDILFFWDARMLMQGLHFMGEAPWKTLYLHGLVRAPDGQKMSKSKGNVVDPLGLIDQYGADALRFFMSAMESQGRDIKMDDARLEGYRNFATKLWNATRFCLSNGISASTTLAAPPATLPVNRWIIGEVAACATRIETALAAYRFDDAANAIYQFAWGSFCDWYLELIKPVLSKAEGPVLNPPRNGEGDRREAGVEGHPQAGAISPPGASPPVPLHHPSDGPPPRSGEDRETRAVAGWVLDQILVMLHPFMPFITEDLWHALGERPYELIVAKWPKPSAEADAEASADIAWLIALVQALRGAKVELGLAPGIRTDLLILNDRRFDANVRSVADGARIDLIDRIIRLAPQLNRLGRIDIVEIAMTGFAVDTATGQKIDRTSYTSGKGAMFTVVVDNVTYAIPLEGLIDLDAERARLTKALAAATKDRDALGQRLSNPAFTDRAKPEAVAKAREDHAAREAEAQRLEAALGRLG